MQPIFEVARRSQERLVYAEGENEDVLRAVQAVVDEKIARPIVIGRPDIIQERIEQMGLRLQAERDFELVNPEKSEGHQEYWEYYHSLVGRNGVSVEAAKSIIHTNSTVLAAVIVALGEADGLICGKVGRFDYHMRDIMGVIGPRARGQHVSSTSTLLLPKGEPLFLADSFINVDPTAEQIVETAKASIEVVRHFGVKPKVALLSHSNFGTSNASSAIKMRKASEILRATMPDVQIDGEMHAMSAMRPELLRTVFKDSVLKGQANLLIMPNLDTANIALGLIRSLTNALLIGPLLSGLAKPAHIVIPSVTPRGILNMSAYTAADIQRYKGKAT
ncbi:MAG: phosphate acyltransferase [Pseudomonadales bacterium]